MPEPLVPPPADGSDPAPNGLLAALATYERALMADDVPELDRLFAPGPATLRGDAEGLLVGHGAIAEFRGRRGGAPPRTLVTVHVRTIDDDHAVVVAVTAPRSGGRGQQTQLWRRSASGWVVDVAHVSGPPPVIDSSVWRTVGAPLVAATRPGPLDGVGVAVKDLVAVAGHAVGAGVPAWLAEAEAEPRHAPAVAALLEAGAHVVGIARTDELAYSIAGRNPHYGTPANAAAPGRLPGGSSSGPASAVALGHADVGLATDTAGSIRVPASYQGLWGLRTTHGAVSTDGVLPLAPSFDTVGWLTRDAATLRAAAVATLGEATTPSGGIVVDPELLAGLAPDVAAATRAAAAALGAEPVDVLGAVGGSLTDLAAQFRVVQAAEAWRTHGGWIGSHPGALGEEVGARFAWAATVTPEQEAAGRRALAAARERLEAVLGDRVLLLPSAASAAPDSRATGPVIEAARTATLALTCLAGTSGRPALSVPALSVPAEDVATAAVAGAGAASGPGQGGGADVPVGLCFLGPPGGDVALVDGAVGWSLRLAAG